MTHLERVIRDRDRAWRCVDSLALVLAVSVVCNLIQALR
jgi:hypothetical protein